MSGPTLPEPTPNLPGQGPADTDETAFEKELDEASQHEGEG